jgi:hypothetical protein
MTLPSLAFCTVACGPVLQRAIDFIDDLNGNVEPDQTEAVNKLLSCALRGLKRRTWISDITTPNGS